VSDAERDSAGLRGMGETPLAGRAALVTGASSGIGQATVRALAAAGGLRRHGTTVTRDGRVSPPATR
jgi:NADPH:quinone reductase-like Zn-dependent oxidoreductase